MSRAPVVFATALALAAAAGCSGASSTPSAPPEPVGRVQMGPSGAHTADGKEIDLITLRNQRQMEVTVISYGGIITSIKTPDKNGHVDDIVLGYDQPATYLSNPTFFGAIIGRYANRIARGHLVVDGQTYALATNDGPNHLHGGTKGWNQQVWTPDPFQDKTGVGVRLTLVSPDGDEHYPGTVTAHVRYTLTDDNRLIIDYDAKTDKTTVINMTQHSYFNLSGGKSADILGHVLTINADKYTPIDATLIPTGELAPVAGTPFDFRTPTPIGARINEKNEQLIRAKGYDQNFVLNRQGPGMVLAAHVSDPMSGRTIEVTTDQPGIQFYSGNFLDGTLTGKGGVKYGLRSGFCLETQHFPDSPNHANFPSTILKPGDEYKTQTIFAFGAQ